MQTVGKATGGVLSKVGLKISEEIPEKIPVMESFLK